MKKKYMTPARDPKQGNLLGLKAINRSSNHNQSIRAIPREQSQESNASNPIGSLWLLFDIPLVSFWDTFGIQ